jgi:FkbM family methyltransferase
VKLVKRAILRAIRAAGYMLVPLPLGDPAALRAGGPTPTAASPPLAVDRDRPPAGTAGPRVDRFAEVEALLRLISPWSGDVPGGFSVDFLGIRTDGSFLWNKAGPFGGRHETTSLPTVASYGEAWFEVASWLLSARDAKDRYVAISLGAAFGAQLVGAWKALHAINPLPARLVAVEPVPENCRWMRSLMTTNGIDPDDHWIIQAAVGADNEPVLFPVGAPGSGLNESVITNSAQSRRAYADLLRRRGHSERVLDNILVHNSTGLTRDLGHGYSGEVKFVSAVTLRDVLAPFDRVDLLEADVQHAEANVIPPFMDHLNRKVRRVHIGTHGREAHDLLRALFARAGWEIVFDYAPNARHETARGPMDLGDGILAARNPQV